VLKKQTGSFDLAMVAWKRAVVVSERKVVLKVPVPGRSSLDRRIRRH
jgi:hypothetical protein